MNRRTPLKRRWKKFWQFVCIAGFVCSCVAGIYALSVYTNNPAGESAPAATFAVASNPSSPTSVTSGTKSAVTNCGSATGGPTDNAIATKYGNNAYPWTDQIKWNCVYNIKDFKGSTIVDQFNAARDAAATSGGGVVYFPAGTYNFTDNIYLKNGVVLRGETPSATDAKAKSYSPPAKLEFPKYEPKLSGNGTPNDTAFKKILTTAPNQDSNIGIVNFDINRAGISLEGDIDTGKNQNIVIFGIRSNNVAEPDPKVPDSSQEPWMRYSYRFAANIDINAYANVLVANNRINDNITDNYEQPGYKVKALQDNSVLTYAEGGKVPFHYGNHYGIVVNRSKASGFQKAAQPNTEPGLFRQGIAIRDNWVYHTMRVGIQGAGNGLVIQDNQISDQSGKQWWTDPTGTKQPKGAVTLENRAIDWSGWNVRIEGNDYEVYRHRVMDTQYLSVDGEGILIQECCGGTTVKGATIANNAGNAYIGLYKVPAIQNVRISENRLLSNIGDTPLIYVVADTNDRPSSMNDVRIENNTLNGGISAKASAGGSNNAIANNRGNSSGTIESSCHVTVSGNTGFEMKPCLK